MIQFNSTFFIPLPKVDNAIGWLKFNYMPVMVKKCGVGNVVFGRLLTAVDEEHVGLTLSGRFISADDAEKWDATVAASLRENFSTEIGLPQMLYFSSMIEILDD